MHGFGVASVAVGASFRRQGIARQLLAAALECAEVAVDPVSVMPLWTARPEVYESSGWQIYAQTGLRRITFQRPDVARTAPSAVLAVPARAMTRTTHARVMSLYPLRGGISGQSGSSAEGKTISAGSGISGNRN